TPGSRATSSGRPRSPARRTDWPSRAATCGRARSSRSGSGARMRSRTRRSTAGDWRGAAEQWDALGFPYEAADARSDSDDEAALLDALAAFDRLGAVAAARRL